MAKTIKFLVKNDLPGATTNHVLVFLKPVDAQSNYQYYAWQDLNPSQGSTQPFNFSIDISGDVIDRNTGSISAQKTINPGQCFAAINPNGQSPYIDTSKDIGGVTSSQAGIKNQCTTPTTSIGVDWYNLGNKVVQVGMTGSDIINVGKTVTFELQPTLYFMAADPTIVGPNFTLQAYSASTPYTLDVSVDTVNVRWYRDSISGEDKFSFDPPSNSFMSAMRLSSSARSSSSAYVEGQYTSVRVVNPLTSETLLSGGTGTMSSFGMFSCGQFAADSLPSIGSIYKISAKDPNGGSFETALKCAHAGSTSDFQDY